VKLVYHHQLHVVQVDHRQLDQFNQVIVGVKVVGMVPGQIGVSHVQPIPSVLVVHHRHINHVVMVQSATLVQRMNMDVIAQQVGMGVKARISVVHVHPIHGVVVAIQHQHVVLVPYHQLVQPIHLSVNVLEDSLEPTVIVAYVKQIIIVAVKTNM
jgi:hypothetical protein